MQPHISYLYLEAPAFVWGEEAGEAELPYPCLWRKSCPTYLLPSRWGGYIAFPWTMMVQICITAHPHTARNWPTGQIMFIQLQDFCILRHVGLSLRMRFSSPDPRLYLFSLHLPKEKVLAVLPDPRLSFIFLSSPPSSLLCHTLYQPLSKLSLASLSVEQVCSSSQAPPPLPLYFIFLIR